MIFKCKNCGGNAIYSPEKNTMFCPYCESVNSEERTDVSSPDITICPSCGGEINIQEHTSATQCPYCESYLILNERVEGQYAPKVLIPFQMGKENCKKLLRNKFKKNLFAPTDFLSEARLNGMRGDYVPYWFYNYDTNCVFHGEGTKIRVWRSGNTEYTETSVYRIDRDMDVAFDKIPADASLAMPDEIMDLMEPYDYSKMIDFTPEYMSGFNGEKYNMPAEQLEDRARKKMNDDAVGLLKQSYAGYGTVRTLSQNVNVKNSSNCYGLLPVWKYIYTYNGQDYPFYVNGQTGKIVGEPPVSRKKVFAYTGTLWACLMAILLLVPQILG